MSPTCHWLIVLIYVLRLVCTTLLANSADDKLIIFFFFFPRKQELPFNANISNGENLHEMSDPVVWEK